MAGKNKVSKSVYILFDDSGGTARNLTGDLVPDSLSGGGFQFDQVDMTGLSESVYNYAAGLAQSTITGQFHMNDTATTGAYTVLTGMQGKAGTLTLQFGSAGAAPTTNDPKWEGEYVLTDCSASLANGRVVLAATWRPSGSTAPAWGTVA